MIVFVVDDDEDDEDDEDDDNEDEKDDDLSFVVSFVDNERY